MSAPARQLTILTGASRGLGEALALALLRNPHAHVLCLSRTQSAALPAAALASGAVLEQWAVDLADAAPVAQRLQDWLHTKLGVHSPQALPAASPTASTSSGTAAAPPWASATLINNAGTIPALTPLRNATAVDTAHALRVGLEAPMLLCSAFLQATAQWPLPRKVLNISSGLGRRAMASQAAYCAAKAGMDHFTRCLALDEALHPHGARVCSLAPGVIDTAMQAQLRGADAAQFPDITRFTELHASGQLSPPAETAQRILAYLARPDFGREPVADIRASGA